MCGDVRRRSTHVIYMRLIRTSTRINGPARTCGQSNLTTDRIADAHKRSSDISQVAHVCIPT